MRKTELIQTVLNSALSEDTKIYWIQSYLLHWVTEDEVLEAIKVLQEGDLVEAIKVLEIIKTKGSC